MNSNNFNTALDAVCQVTGTTKADLLNIKRRISSTLERHLCFYALYVVFDWTYEEIAQAFGYANHATAARACSAIFDSKGHDYDLSARVNIILSICKTAKAA